VIDLDVAPVSPTDRTSPYRLEEARWDQFVEHYSWCETCVLRLDDVGVDDLCPPGRSLFGMWLVSRARLLEILSPGTTSGGELIQRKLARGEAFRSSQPGGPSPGAASCE
jgi:hypothetical protein